MTQYVRWGVESPQDSEPVPDTVRSESFDFEDTRSIRLSMEKGSDSATLIAEENHPIPLKKVLETEMGNASTIWFKVEDTGDTLSISRNIHIRPKPSHGITKRHWTNKGMTARLSEPSTSTSLWDMLFSYSEHVDIAPLMAAFYKSTMLAGAGIAAVAAIGTALGGSIVVGGAFAMAVVFFIYAARNGLDTNAV